MQKITLLIWDWNGTLLDDIDICIQSMNDLLRDRDIPLLEKERYKQVFTFPVKSYYEQIGFDFTKEPFEKPAMEFIRIYRTKLLNAKLAKNVPEVLSYFSRKPVRQFLLSAMEQRMLEQSVFALGVEKYFGKITGLSDNYANGKVKTGIKLMKECHIDPAHTLLIGDTLHDYEVAKELGCHCLLVSNGHQSKERLLKTNALIVDQITELKNIEEHFNFGM